MRAFSKAIVVLAMLTVLPFAFVDHASAIDICSDCEHVDGSFSCGSAAQCMGKMPGFYVTDSSGNIIGRCKDIEHEDCEDEPYEVCCGIEFIYMSWNQDEQFDPPEDIPDDDPNGESWSMFVPNSRPIEYVDVGIGMNHGEMGELVVTLSHGATTVVLMMHPECHVALSCDVPLYFGDLGVAPIQSPPDVCDDVFPGGEVLEGAPYTPLDPLGAFAGQDMEGEWILTVMDMVPGSRAIGQICSWELIFMETAASPVDDSFSWGMIKALYR